MVTGRTDRPTTWQGAFQYERLNNRQIPGGTAAIWMRANESRTHSREVVIRFGHGPVIWTQGGATYHYEPGQNTVYFEASADRLPDAQRLDRADSPDTAEQASGPPDISTHSSSLSSFSAVS